VRAAFLLVLLVACTNSSPERAASSAGSSDAWPRCFELQVGAWTPRPGQQLDVTHAPPAVVQLDTLEAVGAGGPGRRRLSPNAPTLSRAGRGIPPSWTRLASDSLELLWSSGYDGVFVTLAERGDSVSGRARAFTDYGSEASARVTGRRSACFTEVGR